MFHLKQLQSHMGLWIAICNNEQSTRPFLLGISGSDVSGQPSSLSASECDKHPSLPISSQPIRRKFGLRVSPFPAPRTNAKTSATLCQEQTTHFYHQKLIIYIFLRKRDCSPVKNDQLFGNMRTAFLSHWGSPNNHLTGGWRNLSSALPQPEGVSERNFNKA